MLVALSSLPQAYAYAYLDTRPPRYHTSCTGTPKLTSVNAIDTVERLRRELLAGSASDGLWLPGHRGVDCAGPRVGSIGSQEDSS